MIKVSTPATYPTEGSGSLPKVTAVLTNSSKSIQVRDSRTFLSRTGVLPFGTDLRESLIKSSSIMSGHSINRFNSNQTNESVSNSQSMAHTQVGFQFGDLLKSDTKPN